MFILSFIQKTNKIEKECKMSKKRELVYYQYPNFTGIYINRDFVDNTEKKKDESSEKFPALPPYILPNNRYSVFLELAKEYIKTHPWAD